MARRVKRVLALFLSLLAVAVWLSRWTDAEGKRSIPQIAWGQIPRSPAASVPAAPPLPYQVRSVPPGLKEQSAQVPVRRLEEPAPERISPSAPPEPIPPPVSEPGPSRAASPPSPPSADPLQNWVEALLPSILESTLSAFVQITLDRLSATMEAAGETELARRFTEQEFDRVVVQTLERRSQGQVSEITARFEPDGFSGSGTVNLGSQKFVVSIKLSVKLFNQKPHMVLREIRVGSLNISRPTLEALEKQVNRFIDAQRYPLVLKEFHPGNGSVWMSVERV